MRFTWDPRKAATNVRKHGVSFEEAASVFADPLALAVEDAVHPERTLLIGLSEGERVVVAIYSEEDEDTIRISARDAPPRTRGDTMKKARRQQEPSRASLREIPEVDFETAKVRRNPYAEKIAAEGMVHVGRGRPRKGEEKGPTVPRSIRFPAPVWKRLEKRAKSEGISLHAALRAAILEWASR